MELSNEKVEEVLRGTREECLRCMSHRVDGEDNLEYRRAWYYTHLGEIDMCHQLGLITHERHTELYSEWLEHAPVPDEDGE